MKQVRLGNTLTLIPAIGVGTKRYFGGVEPLREAIKLGASLIDTSDTYVSERVVGEAIKGSSRSRIHSGARSPWTPRRRVEGRRGEPATPRYRLF
jgi:diketogulonate reductase-like aldo/keto reductase